MTVELELKREQSAAAIAARLRKMADELESGSVFMVEEQIAVPENFFLTIELEEKLDDDEAGYELEIALFFPVEAIESFDEDEYAEDQEAESEEAITREAGEEE